MSCPYSWVSSWKGCTKDKKCAECRGMEKILKRGKCVECKKPTSKAVLRQNGGTCDSCTDEEMAEYEANLKPTFGEQLWGENWREDIALTEEERGVLSVRGKL